MSITKEYVSWQQIETMVERLARAARERSFDALLAVTRGGLVPAGMMAYHLGMRNILVAAVQFYTGVGQRADTPSFLQFPADPFINGQNVLIVDDIWDSGKTIAAVKSRIVAAGGTPFTAVLHYKPRASLFPDQQPEYYVEATEAWIVYPWEPEDER
ncbi:MAG TPA: phosphoribosyltransferase family protein [Herpetosiphonaceae bacterium]